MEFKKYVALAIFVAAISTGAYLTKTTNKEETTEPAVVPQHEATSNAKLQGTVLPFKVWSAFRNIGVNGPHPINISVAVTGGRPSDWAATAVYLTNVAIKNGAPSSTVEVFQDNPWGDRPPQEYKLLAKSYYDPTQTEEGKEAWAVFVSNKIAPIQDIEFDELTNEIASGQNPEPDPEKQTEKNDKLAESIVVKKYNLPKKWEPDPAFEYLAGGDPYTESDIGVTVTNDSANDVSKIDACLSSKENNSIFKGCYMANEDFPFILPPSKRNPPVDYTAPNILRSNISPSDKCLYLNKYLKIPHHPTADETAGNSMFWAMLFQDAKIPPQNDEIYNELIIATAAKCLADPNISIIIAAKAARHGMSASPSGE